MSKHKDNRGVVVLCLSVRPGTLLIASIAANMACQGLVSTASSNLSPFPHRINNDVMMSKLHSSECQQGKDARELWFSSGCRVVVTHFIKRRNISFKIRTLTPLRRCLGRM